MFIPESRVLCFHEKDMKPKVKERLVYCKVASSNTSGLEAHAGFFRLLLRGIFDPYVRSKS